MWLGGISGEARHGDIFLSARYYRHLISKSICFDFLLTRSVEPIPQDFSEIGAFFPILGMWYFGKEPHTHVKSYFEFSQLLSEIYFSVKLLMMCWSVMIFTLISSLQFDD